MFILSRVIFKKPLGVIPPLRTGRVNEDENFPFDDTQLGNDLRENMKVLGLCWNTDSDEFTFNFDELIKCFAVWGGGGGEVL